MPSYCATLLAIICAVTISSSVSNEAPASAQLINVPRDESHSHRLLRSSPVADAPSSTNAVPSSDTNPDEHEERGFSIKQPYYDLRINVVNKHIRLKAFLLEKYLAFLQAQRKPNDDTFRKMFLALRDMIRKPANRAKHIKSVTDQLIVDKAEYTTHLMKMKEKGMKQQDVRAALHMDESKSASNQMKKSVIESYAIHVKD